MVGSSSSSGGGGGGTTTVFRDGMMLSLSLFGVSAYFFVRHARNWKTMLENQHDTPFHRRRRKSFSDLVEPALRKSSQQDHISARGRSALIPPIPYLKQLLACFQVSAVADSAV